MTKIVVLKIGSSSITSAAGLEPVQVARTMEECFRAIACGWSPVIVTSGARALGDVLLGADASDRALASAVGQPELIQMYRYTADTRRIGTCQVLVSEADLRSSVGMTRLAELLHGACEAGLIPIVNGNDATDVATLNNDDLAAAIAIMAGAEQLVLLTDVPGVYTGADRTVVPTLDRAGLAAVPDQGRSNVGTGGMGHKLAAAARAANCGVRVQVTNLASLDLRRTLEGDDAVGTRIGPWAKAPRAPHRRWLAGVVPADGRITINKEAEESVRSGSSLFSSGIKRASGSFERGAIVEIVDPGKAVIGRGQVTVSSRLLSLVRALTPQENAGVFFAILMRRATSGAELLQRLSGTSTRAPYLAALEEIAGLSENRAGALFGEVMTLVPDLAAVALVAEPGTQTDDILAAIAEHTAYMSLVDRKAVVVFD